VFKEYSPNGNCEPAKQSFYEFLAALGEGQLAASEAVRLYDMCYPLAGAIDRRAQAFAGIPLKVFDKKSQSFITSHHPILDLLARPNANDKGKDFMYALAAFFDITGNSMITGTYALGKVNMPPLEITVRCPSHITIQESLARGTAGYAGEYRVQGSNRSLEVYKLDDTQRNFRWIETSNAGDQVRDLIHIKRFNAKAGLWGTSRAKSIMLEIQQYVEGNKTNLGSLKNGIRPSGAFVGNTGTELTETQWQRVKELADSYKGAQGAGKVFAADGVDFKPMNLTNRDMEYRDLQKDMEIRCNQRYDIPLPLLNEKSTTYNNLATAQFAFYHDAVLPLADVLLENLTLWLMPKYKGSEQLELRYDASDIPALRLRNFEEAKLLRDIHVNTDNEIRTVLGYETRTGSDEIYKPVTQLPQPMLEQSATRIIEANDGVKSHRHEKFVRAVMLEQNKATGQLYTRPEALEMAKRYGIY
jgi:HK97 family phage portal protein